MIRGNYSFMSCYMNCNYQAFRRYIAKDVAYVEGPKQAIGNAGHKAMEQRLSAGRPLPPEFAKYEPTVLALEQHRPQVELSLGMRTDGEPAGAYSADTWINCRVDVWIEVPGYGLMVDWKWAKRREDDFELRIGALLLYARDHSFRSIKGRYFWCNDGLAGELGAEHDLSDFQRTFAEIDSIMSHAEESKRLNHWPKRQGPLCAYCNVIDCEFNSSPGAKR